MRLGVCEASAKMEPGGSEWEALVKATSTQTPDVFLLNEMPFGPWISAGIEPRRDELLNSHRLHDEGLEQLGNLASPVVLGSRPTFEGDRSVNQGFVWDAQSGLIPVHTKQFFPNEAGFYEARWFERGETHFNMAVVGSIGVGFLICTEVMFNEWARHYGRAGAHLIVVPRATPGESLERWRTAVRMAAVVSGCYIASSNRVGRDERGQQFGGSGWIVDPAGDVVAETSANEPVALADVDPAISEAAKREYPCYVDELPG